MNAEKKKAPETTKITKELPFRVPDNYFADFSARLQTRLQAEEHDLPQEKKSIIRYLKPVLGMAASFALIFLLVYWPLKSFLPEYMARYTITEEETETDTYMPSIERIDEDSFFAIIVETINGSEDTGEELNDEELMNYLSANVSDYELFLHTTN